MYRFDFTKDEISYIRSKIYLSEEENEILEDRLYGLSIVEISLKRNISTAKVSRKIKSIYNKMLKIEIDCKK